MLTFATPVHPASPFLCITSPQTMGHLAPTTEFSLLNDLIQHMLSKTRIVHPGLHLLGNSLIN